MKENIQILEQENEKNKKELDEVKQINMNLNHTIDNMKLNYDVEIAKYAKKLNEYENKFNEMAFNNNKEEDE